MTQIQLTPDQLDKLGVDHRSILGSDGDLSSFTFGWKPKAEGGGMFFRASLAKLDGISAELTEHRMVELVKAFETAVTAAGILSAIGRTVLFPVDARASIEIENRKIELPEDWQQ